LADLLLRKGDPEAAVAAATEAVALAPNHVHFQNRLEHMQQRLIAARQSAAAPPVVAPSAPRTVREMVVTARDLSQAGDPAAALDLLIRAADLAPQDGDVQYNLSHVFTALNRPAEALVAAAQAVALQPDNPHWLVRHGLLLMNEAALDEAETKIRAAIAKAPNHAGFHDSLARLLGRQGLLDAAITAAREATSLEPANIHFLEHLSRLLESAGDSEGALAALERAHQSAPDNGRLHTLLTRMRDKYALPQSQPTLA
jgi:tetratricopeptide (TPR) repeat protein